MNRPGRTRTYSPRFWSALPETPASKGLLIFKNLALCQRRGRRWTTPALALFLALNRCLDEQQPLEPPEPHSGALPAARGPELFLRQEAGRPPNHSSAAVSEFRLQRRLDTPTAACTRGGAGSSTISVAPPAGIWCRSGDGHGPLHWGACTGSRPMYHPAAQTIWKAAKTNVQQAAA